MMMLLFHAFNALLTDTTLHKNSDISVCHEFHYTHTYIEIKYIHIYNSIFRLHPMVAMLLDTGYKLLSS